MNKLYDFRRWGIAAALVFVLAGLLWTPSQEGGGLVTAARRDDWGLEPLPRRPDLGSMAVQATQAAYWGNVAATQEIESVKADPRWRIAGLFGREGAHRVLISFVDTTKPDQMLKVGDALPSGHRITRIGERELCFGIGKKSYSLAIERFEIAP